jgi:hypothetical protein
VNDKNIQVQKRTPNIYFVVFFVALGLLFLWREVELINNTNYLRKNGIPARAIVVDVFEFKLISRSYVEFTTVIYSEKIYTLIPVGAYLHEGEEVELLYSPEDPHVVMLTSYPVFHGLGLGAVLCFIFVFIEIKYLFVSSFESQDEDDDTS